MHKLFQTHLHIRVIKEKENNKPVVLIWYFCVSFEELSWTVEISMNLTPNSKAKLTDSTASIGNLKKTLLLNPP